MELWFSNMELWFGLSKLCHGDVDKALDSSQ